jgi:hypothetical protein
MVSIFIGRSCTCKYIWLHYNRNIFDFTLQQYFRPEGNWICYCAALTWNSNVISTHLSPRLHKILVMYEKVNISITLEERERLRLYRSKAVNSDMRACLSKTAESLVCKKSTESIFLCICFCENVPRPGYNSKSEIISLLWRFPNCCESRFICMNVNLERPNPWPTPVQMVTVNAMFYWLIFVRLFLLTNGGTG